MHHLLRSPCTIRAVSVPNSRRHIHFYRWNSKFGGMEVSDAKKPRQLEEENRRLKQLVGELTLDNQALKWIVKRNS